MTGRQFSNVKAEWKSYSVDVTQIQKGLYYSLVTTTEFEPEIPTVLAVGSVEGNRTLPGSSTSEDQIWGNGDAGSESVGAAQIGSICPVSSTHSHINADSALLPPADVERCRNLMTGLVDHFTPILFTPVGDQSFHKLCRFVDMTRPKRGVMCTHVHSSSESQPAL